jgi:hypothetical protein
MKLFRINKKKLERVKRSDLTSKEVAKEYEINLEVFTDEIEKENIKNTAIIRGICKRKSEAQLNAFYKKYIIFD